MQTNPPSQKWAYFINKKKHTTKLKTTIEFQYSTTEQYLKKDGYSMEEMTSINWKGIEGMISKTLMNKKAMAAKVIHNWLPTQAFLCKQTCTECATCPIWEKKNADETFEHVLTCTHTAQQPTEQNYECTALKAKNHRVHITSNT